MRNSKPAFTVSSDHHPVTVRVDLATGRIVLQGTDPQIAAVILELARVGLTVVIDSKGLCG